MTNPVPESPAKYTSRPVTIEAIQWDGTADAATGIINWAMEHGATINYWCEAEEGCPGTENGHVLRVRTPEGDMGASAGWWIIKGTEDEFYPCKDSVFQRKYAKAHTGRLTEPHIPADMLESIGEHHENIRLVQRSISIESIPPASWWTPEGAEPPAFVVRSEVQVYGDRIGMAKRRAPEPSEPHILIQNGQPVG